MTARQVAAGLALANAEGSSACGRRGDPSQNRLPDLRSNSSTELRQDRPAKNRRREPAAGSPAQGVRFLLTLAATQRFVLGRRHDKRAVLPVTGRKSRVR